MKTGSKMKPVPKNLFESGTGSINRFQKKIGLPALPEKLKNRFTAAEPAGSAKYILASFAS